MTKIEQDCRIAWHDAGVRHAERERLIAQTATLRALLADPKVRIGKAVISDYHAEIRHNMDRWQRELKR